MRALLRPCKKEKPSCFVNFTETKLHCPLLPCRFENLSKKTTFTFTDCRHVENDIIQIIKSLQKIDVHLLVKNILFYSEENPLLFTQLYFWGFFAVVLLLYGFFYKKIFLRNLYLFLVSLFFYYKTSGIFLLLLLFTILISYLTGFAVARAKRQGWRKCWLSAGVVLTLSLLGYYKYTYMLVSWINHVAGTSFEVKNILGELSNDLLGSHFDIDRIFLPVGISFFTFQAISYMVDVYQKKLGPVKHFSDYGFYIAFFPQLVAGPIVRAAEFIPQMYRPYRLSREEAGYGIYMILKGLLKKIIFADYVAVNLVDRVFDNPLAYSGFENYLALLGYSLQVYADFSGYTDIAIGTAQLMGFKIPTNFNSPYKALNVGEFWKRWHISLSNWLKDYLYIPLGGNRKGRLRTDINLMITMLLGGLWHGADAKFVLWGGLNGIAIVVYKLWRKISFYEHSRHPLVTVWKITLTFSFITFTRIFFRSADMDIAGAMLEQLGKGIEWTLVPDILFSYRYVLVVMLTGYILHWIPSSTKEFFRGAFINLHWSAQLIVVCVTILCAYQFVTAEMQPFIYFQF